MKNYFHYLTEDHCDNRDKRARGKKQSRSQMSRANNDDQIFMGRAIIKHGLGCCCRHIHYNIKDMEDWGMKNGPS